MTSTETLVAAGRGLSVRSMTGQGAGTASSELGTVSVELRSVNQRGLRLATKISDTLSALEVPLEQLIRNQLKRGSLQVSARFQPAAAVGDSSINIGVVTTYARQLEMVSRQLGVGATIDLAALLSLPGSLSSEPTTAIDPEQLWVLLEQATLVALAGLDQMRGDEGGAMAAKLLADATLITEQLELIRRRAPSVVDQYRERLEGRVQRFLANRGLEVETVDLLREVQLFADRSDISEEITRLDSHLRMFADTLQGDDASGRKLDFIVQEMFRETNTIGSKAGDGEIAAAVVEIKCAIERMRELVQNLE